MESTGSTPASTEVKSAASPAAHPGRIPARRHAEIPAVHAVHAPGEMP
ncbi:hypothetical protein [Streptacidiphilus sp. MAP5-52]